MPPLISWPRRLWRGCAVRPRLPRASRGSSKALASGDHARYLDGDESGIVDDGNAILGHVFGSKDVSRGVAAHAAETTGIGSDTLKQMLPMIAAMIMGALGKKAMGSGGGLGDILGQVLGGSARGAAVSPRASGGGLGDILGQVLGGGSTTGGLASGAAGGGGLGDILGQIVGQGNSGGAPASGAGGIGDILNSIFGGQAAPEVRSEATRRVGDVLGGLLGRDTPSGKAADQLLASVQRTLLTKIGCHRAARIFDGSVWNGGRSELGIEH